MSKKSKSQQDVQLTSNLVDKHIKFQCPICQDKWHSLIDKNNSCPQCGNKDVIKIKN